MAAVKSSMLELGTQAPDFRLPNTNPIVELDEVALSDYSSAKGVLVAFICNHCPYVILIKENFAKFAEEYQSRGLAVLAISSNDAETHPADSPEKMSEDAGKYHYTFPYLYDESQAVAKAYQATCTPDFFLFDNARTLVYRGQYDDSRPNNGKNVTGRDLRTAANSVIAGEAVAIDQIPSIGCSIKWKIGNEPGWSQ